MDEKIYYEDGRFKRKHTRITVLKIPYQMKVNFQFYCASRHKSMSKVLKRIIKKLLQRESIRVNRNIKNRDIYDEPDTEKSK